MAVFISDVTGVTEGGVRVWFSRNNKSLREIDDIREYLIKKLTIKERSDKGVSRETPWLDYYKYGSNVTDKPERKMEVMYDEYYFVYAPEHPRANISGYVKRANLVLEKKIGRYMVKGELAHHRNENKTDDSPGNLQLCTVSEHAIIHQRR